MSYEQVLGAARLLRADDGSPAILSLEPNDLDGVLQTIESVANELGVSERGQDLIADLRMRLDALRRRGERISRKRSVLVLEWPDPPWIGGHWVPDMVAVAGGRNAPQQAMRQGAPSIRVSWAEIEANDPDLIVVAPCGYDRNMAADAIANLAQRPEWSALRAVRSGQVYPVDANRSWSRPGPRLIEGIEELQRILAT